MAGKPVIQFTSGFAGTVLNTKRESRQCSTYRDTPGFNIMEPGGTSNYGGIEVEKRFTAERTANDFFRGNTKRGVAFPSGHGMNPRTRLPRSIDLTKRFESTFKDLGDNKEQERDAVYGKPTVFSLIRLCHLLKLASCLLWIVTLIYVQFYGGKMLM